MSFGTKLTLQEANVHIREVQRIINSRPLTRATASLDDDTCISPMDLIRGYKDDSSIFPEQYVEEYIENLWEQRQPLPQQYLRKKLNRERFWKNLMDGYFEIETLRFSSAGTPQKHGQGQKHRPPQVGDVVLIREDTRKTEWSRAIITELLPSSDGQIRRARVMNSKKHVLERAICDLYSLEINAESVIPAHLDIRLGGQNNQDSGKPEVMDKPQPRKAALVGKAKISQIYADGMT